MVRNDNLTDEEARSRSQMLDVEQYEVHVDLTYAADPGMPAFPTTTTVTFRADVPTSGEAETFIEYIHHSVDSVELNGQKLRISDVVQGSRILLPRLAPTNRLVIHGRSLYSRSGEGLHRFIDPEDGRLYLYTQYEPSDCRRVFPTFEQPDLKAVFRFSVTAPSDWEVASNTEVVSTQEDPVLEGFSKRIFAPTRRMSTYITTLLAGQYHAVSKLYRPSIENSAVAPMTLYCRQSMAQYMESEAIFDLVAKGLDYFQELFAYPYPWGKYDQAFVPEYNLGAMENPGLVTFTESYLFPGGSTLAQREGRANVIMHEMSHMWFGDLVTMRWWSDLWLKESFAEFMGALAAEEVGGFNESWVTFAHRRKDWAYTQDLYSTTHPIVAEIPDVEAAKQNFDGITYAKGASVLKQLVAYVGFDRFVTAARSYFARHEFGTAELSDFLGALEESCGRDLGQWSRAWLESQGVTSLKYNPDRGVLEQSLPDSVTQDLGRPHVLNVASFVLENGVLKKKQGQEADIPSGREGLALELTDFGRGQADDEIVLVNQDDQTYALTSFNSAEIGIAVNYGHTLAEPIDRAVLGSALWNMVRAGELDPRVYTDHVAAGLGVETSATLLDTVLVHAETALFLYMSPDGRSDCLHKFSTAVAEQLPLCEPGSDRQSILTRHGLRLAREDAHLLGFAQELVEFAEQNPGRNEWGGLELSDELVWSARTALAARGVVSGEYLDRALDSHRSQHAAIGAARSKAALPHIEEKHRAWTSIFTNELSNDILSATAAGIRTGTPALRDGLAADYFERLGDVWEKNSIGMATRIVKGLYPGLDDDVDPQVETETWLSENPDAPRALRRELTERLEDAKRAARIRSLWG
ncbi:MULTISPECIES: aminopeptidase N [Micrococcaceae]|uniref:aminopeptidase N n=1 Tax=unclassified Kocuria TaxID=2649579 RepID=UPI001011FFA2|nr:MULTISPECIES: aminopeptidase N [unclassified Kocuria]